MDEAVGYHYTSLENWKRIQIEGLVPYYISKPEFKGRNMPDSIYGIWIWKQELKGRSHMGSILWQLATKCSTQLVYLKVKYDRDKRLQPIGSDGIVQLSHHGHFGDYVYHDYSEKAYIITETILPRKIKLVKTYDLIKLMEVRRKFYG